METEAGHLGGGEFGLVLGSACVLVQELNLWLPWVLSAAHQFQPGPEVEARQVQGSRLVGDDSQERDMMMRYPRATGRLRGMCRGETGQRGRGVCQNSYGPYLQSDVGGVGCV